MATNGHKYELTENLELWENKDLINYVQDTDAMMGLEKHQIILMAQELAYRYEPHAEAEEEYDDEEEDDDNGEYNG